MQIAVQVEPERNALAGVEYRWDEDTDILTATLRGGSASEGMSGSVEIGGADGSWLIFDVVNGSIAGVEVAVWPDVRKLGTLTPPAATEDARLRVPPRRSQPGVAAVEVDTALLAEADAKESTIHFRLGGVKAARTVRIAKDMLVELDENGAIAGVWMLNVPPFPAGELA